MALYVEEHEPSLQAAVLSAVGVGGRENADKDVSRALVERLIEDAVRKCQTIDYGRHVERQGLRRASGLLAAAAALGMAVTILSPAFMRHAAPFLFAPWNVRAANPYAIEVDPGNATVAKGGSQPVTARLKGFESETVELSVRSGPAGDWKRWPMTTEPGDGRVPLRAVRPGRAHRLLRRGGGRALRVFHLDVADIPYVKRVDLEYRFPAYTGLSPQMVADTGDVAALPGNARSVVHVTPTMKVAGGRLQVEGEEARPLTAAEDGTLVASFPVQKDGFYRHRSFPAATAAWPPDSPDYTIDVLADQPPTVTFLKPGRDAKVTSIEEVFTEMRAEDDYGVARAELVYSVNGGPEKIGGPAPGPRAQVRLRRPHVLPGGAVARAGRLHLLLRARRGRERGPPDHDHGHLLHGGAPVLQGVQAGGGARGEGRSGRRATAGPSPTSSGRSSPPPSRSCATSARRGQADGRGPGHPGPRSRAASTTRCSP